MLSYWSDGAELLSWLLLDEWQDGSQVLNSVRADLVLGVLAALALAWEDNQLVLVLLKTLDVGLEGLLAQVDTAVVKSDSDRQSILG